MEVGGGVVVEATVAVGGHSQSGGNGGRLQRVPIEPCHCHEHRTLINHVQWVVASQIITHSSIPRGTI